MNSADLKTNSGYDKSSTFVSEFIKTGCVTADHTTRGPSMDPLWDLHSYCGTHLVGGADVKTTVQLNLFTGTVMNLGDENQCAWMREAFQKGELGAFLLTEKHAGVLSGLIVQTTATWTKGGYVLHSPDPIEQSKKRWISQGLTAKWGVVIARLILEDGTDKGPHAFLVDMDLKGIQKVDMPRKTDFNCLDNICAWFENVNVPHEGLLSKLSYVDKQGEYHLRDPKKPFNFVAVAQRLLSGRICIAGAALNCLEKTIETAVEACESRQIPTGKDSTQCLAKMPFLADLLDEYRSTCIFLKHYQVFLQDSFMNSPNIDPSLVHQIACAKAEIVNFAIDATEHLKKVSGSIALFEDAPWGTKPDLLYVFRFAEGDSAILQQKMARDELKKIGGLFGMLWTLMTIPFTVLRNKNGEGLLRAKLQGELVTLGVRMARASSSQRINLWFKSHALVSSIARKISVLTILDVLCDRVKDLKGSRELAIFQDFYIPKACV